MAARPTTRPSGIALPSELRGSGLTTVGQNSASESIRYNQFQCLASDRSVLALIFAFRGNAASTIDVSAEKRSEFEWDATNHRARARPPRSDGQRLCQVMSTADSGHSQDCNGGWDQAVFDG